MAGGEKPGATDSGRSLRAPNESLSAERRENLLEPRTLTSLTEKPSVTQKHRGPQPRRLQNALKAANAEKNASNHEIRRFKNDHGGYDNDDKNDDHDAMITVTMTTTMIMATPVTAAAAST